MQRTAEHRKADEQMLAEMSQRYRHVSINTIHRVLCRLHTLTQSHREKYASLDPENNYLDTLDAGISAIKQAADTLGHVGGDEAFLGLEELTELVLARPPKEGEFPF